MMIVLAEAYLHRLDPFAIQFTESFGIRWYGLAYAAGFLLAWMFIRWMARSGRSPLNPQSVGDLMIYVIVGVLVGGRLGYVLFYDLPRAFDVGETPLLWDFSGSFPWWGLLAINRGGMASHGGMLGVIIGCWIFARRRKVSAFHLFDVGAIATTPGLFLGRLANFVNAELWGTALPASMQADPPWWSVKYPQEILIDGFGHLPEVTEKLRGVISGGDTFYQNIVTAAVDDNAQVMSVLRPLLTAYYPSQIIQALTDGPVLCGVLLLIWLRPRKPGVIAAWFLIIYGVLRIATEFIRQPDEGVAVVLGLSRGQILSVVMILAGLIGVWLCSRRDVAPYRGICGKAPAGG